MDIERRVVRGDAIKIGDAYPLPEENKVARGLVASRDRLIVNKAPRSAIWRACFLGVTGFRKKSDEMLLEIFDQERHALAQEMSEKGMFGEHPLVSAEVLREQFAHSQGAIEGSLLFGISGSYEATAKSVSRVLFAWQTTQGRLVFSEVDLKDVEVLLEDGKENPTVEFDADRLIYTPPSEGMAVVRRSFGHPNGYINQALARVTFRAENPDQLGQFLVKTARPIQTPPTSG